MARRVRKYGRARGKRRARRLGVTSDGFNKAARVAAGMVGLAVSRRKPAMTGKRIIVGKRKPGVKRGKAHGAQLYFRKHRFGKYGMYNVGLLRKLVVNTMQLRLQGLNRMGSVVSPAVPGWHPLLADLRGGANDSYAPVHVYSLFTVNNNADNIGQSTPCSWRLNFSDTGAPVLQNLFQQNTTGAGADVGFLYEGSDYTSIQHRHKYIRHKWLDIRLLLHGCNAEPTTFDVIIYRVDPKYEYIDPLINVNGLSTADTQRRSAYWQGLAKTLVTNPIMPGHGEALKGMRIVRRYRVVLQPSHSTDENDEPQQKVLKIFMKCPARAHDYDLSGNQGHGADSTFFGTNWTQEDVETGFSNEPPQPQRLYMMIRASNSVWSTDLGTDAATRTNTPSYDIMIRKKIELKR